ncbi:glycerol-3-phosphate 1-O-acyltransferase [Candidatus Liberibacter solanacearum]|uniref:Glycerol-3-phosphate acyltransferase n=1 Tax=Candidatus Liberibacter solanacearum TaxID=556287 RepID=A0A3R7RJD8_9HYPH|nr:glycerol-3-phosphate 1-O-acyltransferase PlsY [Candidatus Liberibacter solanacearum]RPD37333.1 glycerol-3-phosphate 1-O-acyltransferase [Candidatus Liberibacter solanacearum]
MDNLPSFSYEFFAKITAIILGYMIGSIPFGLLLTRICGFNDIRSIGSGNIGATNVLRTGNKKLAFITLLFDSMKATATIIVVSMLFNDKVGALAGLATFLGHIFPVYLKFKGGKGVSTYIGVLIALKPEVVIFFAIIWILFALITRYSSIASLFATLIIALVLWVIHPGINVPIIFTFMTTIVVWKHIENIKRLISGSETEIIFKKYSKKVLKK